MGSVPQFRVSLIERFHCRETSVLIYIFFLFTSSDTVSLKEEADHLYTNLTVSLRDALVGFSVDIKHLDGHIVTTRHIYTL